MADNPRRYNQVAIALHWAIAFGIIFNIGSGYLIATITGRNPAKITPFLDALFTSHQLLGLAVLVLSLFRLGWRLAHKAPELPPSHPLLRLAAQLSHFCLYVAMIGIPLAGALFSAVARKYIPVSVLPDISWTVERIPYFLPQGPAVQRQIMALLMDAHTWLSYTTAALIVIHVAAALMHHYALRDDVLVRMMPRRGNRTRWQAHAES